MSCISSIFQPNYVDQDPHYIPIVLVYVCGSVKAADGLSSAWLTIECLAEVYKRQI
jgi:hypothetical protein